MEARSGGHTEEWSTRIRRIREARVQWRDREQEANRERRGVRIGARRAASGRSGVRVRVSSGLSPLLIQSQRASGKWVRPLAPGEWGLCRFLCGAGR
jgi:hypothetical protein